MRRNTQRVCTESLFIRQIVRLDFCSHVFLKEVYLVLFSGHLLHHLVQILSLLRKVGPITPTKLRMEHECSRHHRHVKRFPTSTPDVMYL